MDKQMIKIDNQNIDLVLQVEEYTGISKVLNLLTLDINEVLIICPQLFLERFTQELYEIALDEKCLSWVETKLIKKENYIDALIHYKRKQFNIHFLITRSEVTVINNPFNGEQIYKIGINKIDIK